MFRDNTFKLEEMTAKIDRLAEEQTNIFQMLSEVRNLVVKNQYLTMTELQKATEITKTVETDAQFMNSDGLYDYQMMKKRKLNKGESKDDN